MQFGSTGDGTQELLWGVWIGHGAGVDVGTCGGDWALSNELGISPWPFSLQNTGVWARVLVCDFAIFGWVFWFVLYKMGSPWLSNKQGDLGISMEGTCLEYSWITMLISVLPCLTLPFSCWMLVGWKEHQRLESHAAMPMPDWPEERSHCPCGTGRVVFWWSFQ